MKIVEAIEQWPEYPGRLSVYVNGDNALEGLVTTSPLIERKYHRGIHVSVLKAKRVAPIFYNGCGWVDVGEAFYRRACKVAGIRPNESIIRQNDLLVQPK